jgi:TRAP-type C4-dicarboxylate transport system permease small subunit
MKILRLIDRALDTVAGWLIVGFLGLMIAMAFSQVILRNFFHASIEWGDIFLRHLVLWVGFLGAVIAAGERRHLKIEFISKLVSKKPHKIFLIITNFFASIVCCFLMQAAVSFVQQEVESASTLILNLPTWYFIVILPIGYAVLAFRCAAHSILWIGEIVQGNWDVAEVQHI